MSKTIKINDTDIKTGKKSKDRKDINVNIKITNNLNSWIKSNKYSPTRIFEKACEWLGYNK